MVVVALAAAGLCLLALVWTRGARGPGEPAGPVSSGPEPPLVEPRPVTPRLSLGIGSESLAEGERPPVSQRPSVPPEERFAGTAHIDGYLDLPPGEPVPRPWTLVLEPSRVLIGGEHAVERRVVFEAGEREFTLEDVPLGGYELSAKAEGMSGSHELLLLTRPDNQLVVVHVSLQRAAFVEGVVQYEDGTPVADMPLHLRLLAGNVRLSTRADARGAFLFESVPDGEYRLFAGHPMSPVTAALDLAVRPPSLHVPPIVVPRLGTLRVDVVGPDGSPVPDAQVEGWGSNGGRVEERTDVSGAATARFLPAGRYSLRASAGTAPSQRTGRVAVDVSAGSEQAIRIELDG